jgi:hypothetical protein
MKLRFRGNGVRLRVNQHEVDELAAGRGLSESVHFPGGTSLSYTVEPFSGPEPVVTFEKSVIRVSVPSPVFTAWAHREDIGLYFDFPGGHSALQVAIEKDLECLHGPKEERDPDAFPRN